MRSTTGILALALLSSLSCSQRAATASEGKPLVCDEGSPRAPAAHAPPGNPAARGAAQKGLRYLAKASLDWTQKNGCFGCHVQAVTLEAMTVGRHHKFDVGQQDLDAMVAALRLGVTAGGRVTGAAFEGQAWARYDAWIDAKHTDDLLKYATELVGLQAKDGSVPDDDARLPVTGGVMHTTFQAAQTWRQAYARTADDKWRAPLRKAEQYLSTQSSDWKPSSTVYLQNVSFALLGLVAAGVGPGEEAALRLQRILLARQNQDGGWGLEAQKSDGLATGQTLYALRLSGHGDGERAIERGTAWLVEHQGGDGAWRTVTSRQGGAEKGEGMWAVLGLVSMDMTSIALTGIIDGQHVAQTLPLDVTATDNQGGGVSKLELVLDDRPLTGACAAKLSYAWKTDGLSEGKHTLDVLATNGKGQVSKRRYEVYAGNVFLTDVGTRFDEASRATEIGARNLAASAEAAGQVELAIFSAAGEAGKRGARVYGTEQKGAPGAMTFRWDGVGSDKKPQPGGRYLAELTLRDRTGKVIQKTETLFVQDSEAAQRANFAEIEGQLALPGGASSANTAVELVDDKGNVVQRVQSTEQGNYRFKSVSGGNYKVRTLKDGFRADEQAVKAAPASGPAKVDVTLR